MFDLLFERSADAIWLFDPDNVVFVECNQAAVVSEWWIRSRPPRAERITRGPIPARCTRASDFGLRIESAAKAVGSGSSCFTLISIFKWSSGLTPNTR